MENHSETGRALESLKSGAQFRQVYQQGQKISTSYFAAFFLPSESGAQRLGITVTRKIGNAVVRNRCKRRLRELFRLRDRSLNGPAGFDVVINVRSDMINASHQQLQLALNTAYRRFRTTLEQKSSSRGGPKAGSPQNIPDQTGGRVNGSKEGPDGGTAGGAGGP
ncbi:MAG: ribonuclease P protein component [Blastocatellia bacterium]